MASGARREIRATRRRLGRRSHALKLRRRDAHHPSGYGADEIYTRMSMRSLDMWLDLFQRTGDPLFHRTGVLRLSHDDDAYSVASRATLARVGAPHEVVSPDELARRWPQMRLPVPGTYGLFEPESGALMARRAVAAVVDQAIALGADYAIQSVTWPNPQIDAATFVFACGPWLPKLFPEILGRRIYPTRQEVYFFAPPAGDDSFAPGSLPVWTDFTDPSGPYGFPDIEGRGIKLAFDRAWRTVRSRHWLAHGFSRGRRACPPISGRAIPRAARRSAHGIARLPVRQYLKWGFPDRPPSG